MELPGTAPGSDPCITSAFMTIVPRDKNVLICFDKKWKGVVFYGYRFSFRFSSCFTTFRKSSIVLTGSGPWWESTLALPRNSNPGETNV